MLGGGAPTGGSSADASGGSPADASGGSSAEAPGGSSADVPGGSSADFPAGSPAVEDPGGAGASSAPLSCFDNADCPDAWTCEKESCTASAGSCIPHPIFCDLAPAPVCGCDGITYWNDCLRKQIGPSASTSGECETNARRCRDARECGGPNTRCGRLVLPGDPCGPIPDGHMPGPDEEPGGLPPPPPGNCWAIPDSCDPSLDPLRWDECGGPEPRACTDTCGALRSGRPHVKNVTGMCP